MTPFARFCLSGGKMKLAVCLWPRMGTLGVKDEIARCLKNIILPQEIPRPGLKSVNCVLTSGWWALLRRQLHSKLRWHFQEFTFLSLPIGFSSSLVYCSKRIASRKELIFTEHLQQSVAVLNTFMNGIILTFKMISFLGENGETGHLLNKTKIRQLICRRLKTQTQACLTPNTERFALWMFYKKEGSAKSLTGHFNIDNKCLILLIVGAMVPVWHSPENVSIWNLFLPMGHPKPEECVCPKWGDTLKNR